MGVTTLFYEENQKKRVVLFITTLLQIPKFTFIFPNFFYDAATNYFTT